jgi:INO80 complex subunit E
MVSNEGSQQLKSSYKTKYRELKKRLKYLVYENECFTADIKDTQMKLLQINREKSFLLDQLMQHETIKLSDNDMESTDYSSDEEVVPPPLQTIPTSTNTTNKTTSNKGGGAQRPPLKGTPKGGTGRKARVPAAGRQAAGGRKPKAPPVANATTKALSLVVSLPRPVPEPLRGPQQGKLMVPAARKKFKKPSTSSSSGSSSSSDSNSSSSSDSEGPPIAPPPLHSIINPTAANVPHKGVAPGQGVVTTISAQPSLIVSPNVRTTPTVNIVPSLSLSSHPNIVILPSPTSKITTPTTSEGGRSSSAFHIVKATNSNPIQKKPHQ